LVVGIAVGVLIGLPLAFVMFAALIPLGIAAALSPVMLVPLVMLICFIALLSAALRSIVEAYTSTVWTLAYRQWMAGPAPAPAPVSGRGLKALPNRWLVFVYALRLCYNSH